MQEEVVEGFPYHQELEVVDMLGQTGYLVPVKWTAGHTISFDLDPIKRCRFSGADRLLDRFKYILCHVPLTAGLFHRGLVSGGFRTLTGSFATLGAVWLPD